MEDDKSESSSPDPLAYPGDPEYILSSATKPFFRRQTLSPRKSRTPSRRQSPTKADPRSVQSIKFQDIVLPSTPSGRFKGKHRLSPSKTTTLHSDNNTSPWRIRVTVEAEQDEEDGKGPSTNSRRGGRTIKVPLKDEKDSGEPSPKRRRTEKSAVSQRVPTPRRRPSAVDTPSGNTDTGEKKKRGRLRKSLPSTEEGSTAKRVTFADSVREKMREEDPFLNIAADGNESDDAAVDNILPDISVQNPDPGFLNPNNSDRSSPTPNEKNSSRNPDTPARKTSPTSAHLSDPASSTNTPRVPTGLTPENTIDAGHTPGFRIRVYPTPTSSSLLEDDPVENATLHSSAAKKRQSGSGLQALTDPTDQHREFDSILESEGFSMVSLDTLPSARQQINNSFQGAVSQGLINSMNKAPRNVRPGASKLRIGDARSSPHIQESRSPSRSSQQPQKGSRRSHQTPGVRLSSPPQPPAPATRSTGKSRLVRLVRVIRAGIALQGVLRRQRRNPRLQSPFSSPSHSRLDEPDAARERLDALFQGLGSETERELRAGLRFGEELAKRLRESQSRRRQEETKGRIESPEMQDAFANGDDDNNNDVGYPDIDNLPRSNRVSPFSAESQANWEPGPRSTRLAGTPNGRNQSPQQSIGSEMARREAEWQREREAISREIQQANSSQVIVIDSDDGSPERSTAGDQEIAENYENEPEDEGDDYEDIWQQEARNDAEVHSEPESYVELSREELIKPPRRVLPSPWRRKEDAEVSQDESTPGPGPYWTTRQNDFPILPSGKTQTARFREQELSSLLGSPESATRRFYQESEVTPQSRSTQYEQQVPYEQQQNYGNVSSPAAFARSRQQPETSYSDEHGSDAYASGFPWAPSSENHRNDTGATSPHDIDTHPERPMEDHMYPETDRRDAGHTSSRDIDQYSEQPVEDHMYPDLQGDDAGHTSPRDIDQYSEQPVEEPIYPELHRDDARHGSQHDVDMYSEQPVEDHMHPDFPSGSMHSPGNGTDVEGWIYPDMESQDATPRAPQGDQDVRNRYNVEPQSPVEEAEAQQEAPPSSWFKRITDLAPSWLTTPASRKAEKRQPEYVGIPASPCHEDSDQQTPSQRYPVQRSPVGKSSVQASSVQRSSIQRSSIYHSSFRKSPVQTSSDQRSPVQHSSAERSVVHRTSGRRSSVQRSPVQRSSAKWSSVRSPVHRYPVQQSPVQRSSTQRDPPQQPPVRGLPARNLPNQKYPAQDFPAGGPPALDSPAEEAPVKDSAVLQSTHEPIKKPTVDAGTQCSPPPASKPKRKPQNRKQPPQRKTLAISGYFTDDHYVALRKLYHQAKISPRSFPYIETPERNEMLGQRIFSADLVYSRRITETQIAIADKFRRDLAEGSRRRGGMGKVEWSEEEILRRLVSIIIGEQVRRERKRDLEHHLARQSA
ncbi:hypothetical protein AJ79_04509 [Helicocarpus griseus UAMH5409]|uniref:AT DNA binding protein n=1 Tax=Helicocarpus griseus UAMH5409 TaxID=1447875 RepID=A0A2B7XSN6_9EURO|nr:hypothetical protein AJ79_04509 [Helicocarpus griseus UAMH5409]